MLKFLKNIWTVLILGFITIFIISGSLAGTYQDPAIFSELMKESAKLNVSVALGLGALVVACLIFQNKTDIKVNIDKYFKYMGIMFYFILINLGVFYLAYFPRLWFYEIIFIIYFILMMLGLVSLLYSTSIILATIFKKHSL